MEVRLYNFARLEDGLMAVERQALELESRARRGEKLAEEERDWLDWANGISLSANNQPVAA